LENQPAILIDIPEEKGVHIRTAGDKRAKYVYQYTKYYRNTNGNPRNRATVIGKLDSSSGKMIPNTNYYQMYNIMPGIPDMSCCQYGFTYLGIKCCRDIGLWDCLEKSFGTQVNEIVASALYMIREGNAMDGITVWQEKNFIPGLQKLLSSQSSSKLFESFNQIKLNHFFEMWINTALIDETICYDVTSISSYSKEISGVEYGYNRDGEDLPQINLGIFCGETSKTPLYYNRYNGSLTDKTNLSYVLNNAKSAGLTNVKIVVDGGFISEECFKTLDKLCKAFTIGIGSSLKISRDMINSNCAKIEIYDNKLPLQEIFCVHKPISIHGIKGKLMLYCDPERRTEKNNALSNHIELLSSELSKFKRIPKNNLARYSKYFIIADHKNGKGFDFRVNSNEVDKQRSANGLFLIFTTDMLAKPEDILYFYRAKDADEKLFDQIKVDMRGNRVRTHNDQTTEGKIFVTFIALIIRAYILGKLGKYIAANATSLKLIIKKLENIIIIRSGRMCRLSKALTKEQKNILDTFNAKDDINASISSCIL
jgi:transposase